MPNARCKIKVREVKQTEPEFGTNDQPAETIKMSVEYDDNDPEDTKFSASTPWGEFNFKLTNPALLGQFKPGQSYWLDLTPVE